MQMRWWNPWSPLQERSCIFQQHCVVEITHSLDAELVCLHSSPLTTWKHLAYCEMKNNGTTLLSPKSNSCSPQFTDVNRLLLREDEMLQTGKHGPVPFSSCIVHFLHLNIWRVFYDLVWISNGFMRFANHLILFLFRFDRASQHFF